MKFASGHGFGWICVVTLALNACGDGGGDGDGNGGGNRAKVSNGKQINQLTDAEKTALCEEFAARYEPISEDLKAPSCAVAGLIAEASGLGTCEEARDQCLTAEEEPAEEADCTMTGDTAATCELSVGEYRGCLDALAQQAKDSAKTITCDSDLQELQNTQSATMPAACQAVQQKCPELIGDGEDEEIEDDAGQAGDGDVDAGI